MLTDAYKQGQADAFRRFGIKTAAGTVMPAIRNFAAGQAGHLGNAAQALQSGFTHGFGAGHGTQLWDATKGLLPTIGGAAALGLGAHMLGGDDDRRR